jgi:hypothetical protein
MFESGLSCSSRFKEAIEVEKSLKIESELEFLYLNPRIMKHR